jgi:hypothetical protein
MESKTGAVRFVAYQLLNREDSQFADHPRGVKIYSSCQLEEDFDDRKDALAWIKAQPSTRRFTILEVRYGGGGG